MEATRAPTAKPAAKGVDINVLHCLNPECRGLLAYEVDSNNVLYLDLAWMAKTDGSKRWFPCPKCKGKNLLEAITNDKGQKKQRVAGYEA